MNPEQPNQMPDRPPASTNGEPVKPEAQAAAAPPPIEHPNLPPPSAKQQKRSRATLWLTLIMILLGIAWFLYWFLYAQYYEYTDDAYTNGNYINVTSVIEGTPIAFYADDTDLVEEGQLLIALDQTPYRVAYEKELAALASVILQVNQIYDNVLVSEETVKNRGISLDRVQYDFNNRKPLAEAQAISNEEFIHSQDDLRLAQSNLKQSQEQLRVAKDARGNTPIDKHPQIIQQINAVINAYYKLQHCFIYAPATGYVAKRAVQLGQWINPETYTMAIIPTTGMWVDANYKETQLGNMRIGQPATVTLDIYGSSLVFNGTVGGIASGTGSVFSLIPPQNATGNWIKIVQRLPVRIYLDPKQTERFPMRLGISAEVYVDITNTDLPMFAPKPHTLPIGTTTVFNLDYKEAEEAISKIMKANINPLHLKGQNE